MTRAGSIDQLHSKVGFRSLLTSTYLVRSPRGVVIRCVYLLAILFASTYSSPSLAASPPQFQLVALPPLPGDTSSFAEDVNNTGVVVGRSWQLGQALDSRSVSWSHGVSTQLWANNSGAYAINEAGNVAGTLASDTDGYFLSGGSLISVHTATLNAVGNFSVALDLNNANQVAGWVANGGSGQRSAYLWQNGVAILLGTLGGTESAALAINNLGDVGGYSETPNHNDRAFIWRDGNHNNMSDPGEMHQLPDLGLSSVVNDLNDAGQAAGWVLNASFKRQPVIWNDALGFTPLPLLSGQLEAEPLGINTHGDVVGTSQGRALFWHDGEVFDLNQLVPPGSGFNLLRATEINDHGWIVGAGVQAGAEVGFLLIPIAVPEPSTAVLAVGFAVCLARRPTRRR